MCHHCHMPGFDWQTQGRGREYLESQEPTKSLESVKYSLKCVGFFFLVLARPPWTMTPGSSEVNL